MIKVYIKSHIIKLFFLLVAPVTESFDISKLLHCLNQPVTFFFLDTNLLSVTKNQAATTSLVWTPPNDSNGIKYYHLTLHLAPEGRAMKEWTVHPTQIFNISIALGMFTL